MGNGALKRVVLTLAVGFAWVAAAASASAHTSYLRPNLFSTADAQAVTIQSSFTEDFFNPEVAVESQDFHYYLPDGARHDYDRVSVLRQMTVLEAGLSAPGTYLFSTGERLGRTGLQVRVNGEWQPLEPGATPPAGAETRQSQTATVANVYVTKGAPTNAALSVNVGHLIIRPVTHPSEIYLSEGFRFRVLFDGTPVANQEVHVYREGGAYDATPFDQVVRTDASGAVALSFTQPGVYLVMTRKSAPAPAGAATAIRSYTTSLTFEVSR